MDKNRIIQLTAELLQEGHTTRIKAYGISMFPLLLPGDQLTIAPGAEPEKGDIVVFKGSKTLIAHRLISIEHNAYICRGDSLWTTDSPLKKEEILGKVIARTRNGKTKTHTSRVFRQYKRLMPALGKYPRALLRYTALVYARLKPGK